MGFHMCRGHTWDESLNHFEMDKIFFFFPPICDVCIYIYMYSSAMCGLSSINVYAKRFAGDAKCDGCDSCDRAAAEAVASASGAATSNEVLCLHRTTVAPDYVLLSSRKPTS